MNLSYADWIARIFDHPASAEPSTWSPDIGDVSPAQTIAHMTRLFSRCGEDLAQFDDVQVAQGLWFLCSAGNSDSMYHLYDRTIDWSERRACIRSMVNLYRDCFARRVPNAANRFRVSTPLSGACFMWWDVFPSGSINDTTDEERAVADRELIDVMASALNIEHLACQESAIHGLGHWQIADALRVASIIVAWLGKHQDAPDDLRAYAEDARTGNVL